LASNQLSQHINEPTRYRGDEGSILDLIISNEQGLVRKVEVTAPIHHNDHCTISCEVNLPLSKPRAYKRTMWAYKKANFDTFRQKLDEVPWDQCLESNDPNQACDTWTQMMTQVVKDNIPHKEVTVRPGENHWYNGYLRRLCRKQKRDHKMWTRNKSPTTRETYRVSRNKYFEEVDRLKLEHEESLSETLATESKTNPKKWWAVAKDTMGNKTKSTIPSMLSQDEVFNTDQEKADLFNDYFVNVQTIPNAPEHPNLGDPPPVENILESITVQEKDVNDVLLCLNTNKAYGPDGLSPRVLKEGRTSIVKILTKIFNLSLAKGIFPNSWKLANVTPIYKKAEEYFTENYRPISLLCTIAKVFERVVFKYLYNFFRDNFIFSIWQSGFLPGCSTVTQLIEIYDQFCKAVSQGKEIRVVFLDISKAFDRVWHAGLLHKLKGHGIRGTLLKWLHSYLTDRHQRVVINGIHSAWGKIKAGVPQGSVLGPLLFLIFINDITHVIRRCKIRLFADDTCLFIHVDEPEEAAAALNDDLKNIQDWADKWLVTFSPPKTKELLITNKQPRDHPILKLNNQQIEPVDHHKHLGVHLSKDLTWKKHASEIAKKAARCVGILRRLKFKIDRASLETLYKSFVRPILEYADSVWDVPDSNRHGLDILENVQTEAARVVTGATARCSTEKLYEEVGWEELAPRRRFHRALVMFKIMNGLAPSYLYDLIPPRVEARTAYNLRNRADLQQPFARLQTYAQSFFPSTIKMWNDLSHSIKNSASVKSFKHNYLKEFQRPKQNPLFYRGRRRPAVYHSRMRIGCSGLNADLHHVLHVVDSPTCTCAAGVDETPHHFFLNCQRYTAERRKLLLTLAQLNHPNPDVNLLLRGDPLSNIDHNTAVFTAVHEFIIESKRFS
jgi:hypothetical protein